MAGVLVVNAGSSSLKFALYVLEESGLAVRYRGLADGLGEESPRLKIAGADGAILKEGDLPPRADQEAALGVVLPWLEEHLADVPLIAAGHRVVHGGRDFAAPLVVDSKNIHTLEALSPLAPLHQPHNLAAIRAVLGLKPDLPQVACFDTAFHRRQPRVAQRFALPRRYTEQGVLRYGFHGLSYEYIAGILPDYDPRAAGGRTIVAHLGHGASLCALDAGRSVATTMGFTALDGLPMGSRCGNLDPGVILYFLQSEGLSVDAVQDILYRQSGLRGVSGISDDMRELLASSEKSAGEAIDLFVYRTVREIGSLTAALGGLDALVFTAGIGEHAHEVRRRICESLGWLDLRLNADANEAGGPRVSEDGSAVAVWVIPTNEELIIARHTLAASRTSG